MAIISGPTAVVGRQRAVRTITAPTEAEARAMAAPVVAAFAAGGWAPEDDLWIPPDRRVGLGESLLLDAEDQNLLEANGHLRLTFTSDDPAAVEPGIEAATRQPDVFEDIGGMRYRRLVPRYAIGLVGFVVVGFLALAMFGSMAGRQNTLGGTNFGPPTYGKPDIPGVVDPDANGSCPTGLTPISVEWTDGSTHLGCFTP